MRIDKYDPVDGGFRAPLANDQASTPGGLGDEDAAVGVGLDANGRVVVAGDGAINTTGVKGLLVLTRNHSAGDVVDVMTDGEIVEFGGAAGTDYFVDPSDGVISADPDRTAAGTGEYVGHTVEAGRLIVRVAR